MTSTLDTTTEFWRAPALPYVESRRACHSRACYKAHSHPTFSIGAVDLGSSYFTGAAGGPVLIQAGTVVFVPSVCVHSCNPLPNTAWSYQMLHLDAAWLQALRQESGIGQRKDVTLTRDASVYARFCQLNVFLFCAASVYEKEAALIAFIGDCGSDDQETITTSEQATFACGRLQPVLERLQYDGIAMGSLAELAKVAGMSRYQLIRAFRASTGMTPHVYQLNLRINQARVWLRSGEEMADIAYRLGFADQSHFQRVFKAYAGVTPGLYRS
ncbi:MAG: AraC family transcriptional regulator [Glaciimonas sp.]|nr:AraC family transcriptional regulator [Glaciimonas sp.]